MSKLGDYYKENKKEKENTFSSDISMSGPSKLGSYVAQNYAGKLSRYTTAEQVEREKELRAITDKISFLSKNKDYLNAYDSWSKGISDYLERWDTGYKGLYDGYHPVSDVDTFENSFENERQSYLSKAAEYRDFFSKNNQYFDEDSVKAMDSLIDVLNNQGTYLGETRDYLGQFLDESDYETAKWLNAPTTSRSLEEIQKDISNGYNYKTDEYYLKLRAKEFNDLYEEYASKPDFALVTGYDLNAKKKTSDYERIMRENSPSQYGNADGVIPFGTANTGTDELNEFAEELASTGQFGTQQDILDILTAIYNYEHVKALEGTDALDFTARNRVFEDINDKYRQYESAGRNRYLNTLYKEQDAAADNLTQEYLAKISEANWKDKNADIKGQLGGYAKHWDTASKDEQKVMRFLANTNVLELNHYLNDMERVWTAREATDRKESIREWTSKNAFNAVLGSVGTVFAKFLKPTSAIGQLTQLAFEGSVDPNADYNIPSEFYTTVRGTVAKNIEDSSSPILGEGYQLGMSMVDSIMDILLIYALQGVGVADKVAESVALGITSSGVAADTVIAKKEQGYSDTDAMLYGAITGAAEFITEKYSLEVILSPDFMAEGAARYIAKSAFAEGSEEIASNLMSDMFDIIFMGNKGEWNRAINDYMREGLSYSDAFARAIADKGIEYAKSGAGGMLSGGLLAGGRTGLNAVNDYAKGAEFLEGDYGTGYSDLIDKGLSYPNYSWAHRAAETLASDTKKRSRIKTGELISALHYEAQNEEAGRSLVTRAAIEMYTVGEITRETAEAMFENESLQRVLNQNGIYNESTLIEISKEEAQSDIETESSLRDQASQKAEDLVSQFKTFVNNLDDDAGAVKDIVLENADYSNPESLMPFFTAVSEAYDSGYEGRPMNVDLVGDTNYTVLEQAQKAGIKARYNAQEAQETGGSNESEEGKLYLRGGSERAYGENTGKQTRSVGERTGEKTPGRSEQGLDEGNGKKNSGTNGKEISAVDLKLKDGTDKTKIRLWGDVLKPDMKTAKELATKHGLKTVFFYGNNLSTGTKKGNVRGFIRGNTIYIRADHPYFTPEQIVKHEIFHSIVADKNEKTHKLNVERLWNDLRHSIGRENLNELLDHYKEAYWTEEMLQDADEKTLKAMEQALMEEILADMYAGMNTFKTASRYAAYWDTVDGILDSAQLYRDYAESEAEEKIKARNRENGVAEQFSAEIVPYSQKEKDSWANSKKIVVYDGTVEQIIGFVKNALSDGSFKRKLYFGKISGVLADRIQRETGISAFGKNITLYADNIRKVQKYHGNADSESKKGQRAVVSSDYAKIPEIIVNAQKLIAGTYEKTGKPSVTFEWKKENERYNLVLVENGQSMDIFVQTFYINIKKGSIARLDDAQGSKQTSETTSGTASTDNINQLHSESQAETMNMSLEIVEDSEGNQLSKEQGDFFKDSKIRDEDGRLQVVYHGTDQEFTVFDRTKGRSTMDIQGSFFSPWEIDAQGYGSNVQAYYLNIKNPASEGTAYKALIRFKGQNEAGRKAREYLESLGYDGVNNSNEEYIAFYPEQIKLISNATPTTSTDVRLSEEIDYSEAQKEYSGRSLTEDKEVYSYAFLSSLPDLRIVEMTDGSELFTNKARIDRKKTVKNGMANARRVGEVSEKGNGVVVKNNYTGRKLTVYNSSVEHSLGGQSKRSVASIITNSRLASAIGEIVQTAVPINALKNAADVKGTYAMAGYAIGADGREMIGILTVEEHKSEISEMEFYDVVHALSGRIRKGTADGHEAPPVLNGFNTVPSKITIADFLKIVKETHQSILSDDVLKHFGETKNKTGRYTNEVLFSEEIHDFAGEPATLTEAKRMLSKIQRENERLKERNEYLEGQMKTSVVHLDPKSAQRWTKRIVKEYGTDIDSEKVTAALTEAGRLYIEEYGKTETPELELKIRDALRPAAEEIILHAKEKTEEDKSGYESLRSVLKAGIKLSEQDKSNIVDLNHWKKANFGYVTLTDKGQSMDTLYMELQDKFGRDLFPDEISNPADQLVRAVEVLKDLKGVYENPFQSFDMAEALTVVTDDLMTSLYNGMIRQADPTYADKMEAKLAKERANIARKIEEAVAENQKKNDRTIEELKRYYKENTKLAVRAQKLQDMSERDRISKNEKLRRLIRRLRNRKLSAVNRARIDEIIGELDTEYIRLTGDKLEELQSLDDFIRDNDDVIFPEHTKKAVASLRKKYIGELTQEEVANLTEVLLSIETEIANANKQIDTEDKRETFRQAFSVMNDIRNTRGTHPGFIRELHSVLVLNTLSPERFGRTITGYVEGDPLQNAFYDLTKGETKMIDHQMKAYGLFDKWTNDKALMKKWQGRHADVITINGQGRNGSYINVEITPAKRVSLYLHSLNDDNMRHIQYGGVKIPDMKLYKAGKFADAYSAGVTIKLTRADIHKIAQGMSNEELAFVHAIQGYFQGMSKDSINEVSEKLLGWDIAGEENYFPIYTDSNFIKTNFDGMKYDGTIEGMGFLKERINSVSPIYLEDATKVMKRSIDSTARYVGLAIPVRNVNKLLGVSSGEFIEQGRYQGDITVYAANDSILASIDAKYGKPGIEYVRQLMRNIQTGSHEMTPYEQLFRKLRSNYAGAVLTLNAGVAMKQAASYPTAAAVLGAKPLLRAMRFDQFGKVDLENIAKYTPVQWYRSRGFTTQELGDIKASGVNIPSWLNWIQLVDLMTTRKLWKASEFYVQDHNPELKKGTEEYYDEVGTIYNKVIWDTQPNYTTMQRPGNLRSDNFLVQTLMMFKTQPFQNFNILYDAVGNFKAKKNEYFAVKRGGNTEALKTAEANYREAGRNVRRAIGSQVVSLIVFAGMTALWSFLQGKKDKYKDKDGDENVLTWLAGIGKDALGGAAGMVPFGSDAWDVMSSLIFKDRYYGYSSVADSALKDLLDTIQSTASAITEGKMTPAKWKKLIKNTAQALGIPAKNVANLINGILQWFGVEALL